jgi:hypothetical protein
LAVGYTNALHLVPVAAGLALFILALALSYPYLCAGESAAREWRERARATACDHWQ